jgi:hypothetical protein
MLRSLINSMKGRSALAVERELVQQAAVGTGEGSGAGAVGGVAVVPERTERFIPVIEQVKTTSRRAPVPRPERCCVHCGHALYVPRGAHRVRCPMCCTEVSVQDVTLTGDVVQEHVVTAGRIVVEENARVAAKLVASSIDIAGRVLGDVLASNVCTIRETGKQAGKILCRRLDLRPGAEIDGAIELIRDEQVQ